MSPSFWASASYCNFSHSFFSHCSFTFHCFVTFFSTFNVTFVHSFLVFEQFCHNFYDTSLFRLVSVKHCDTSEVVMFNNSLRQNLFEIRHVISTDRTLIGLVVSENNVNILTEEATKIRMLRTWFVSHKQNIHGIFSQMHPRINYIPKMVVLHDENAGVMTWAHLCEIGWNRLHKGRSGKLWRRPLPSSGTT